MLKNPFETNSIPWYPKTVEQIISTLQLLNANYFGKIPYTMLQPCMDNRKVTYFYSLIVINNENILIGIESGVVQWKSSICLYS